MEKIFVDTSAWVALFVKNDDYYKKASLIFERIKKEKAELYTSDYIIDETITTILARGNHRQSVHAGNVLLTSNLIKIISVSLDYFQETWKHYQKFHDKHLSFTDVSCFVVMKDLKITKAFSFDREFLQVGLELL